MKAAILATFATLAAFQAVCALPAEASAAKDSVAKLTPLPEGLADGIYAGNLNDDGTTSWELIETLNVTELEPAVQKRQGSWGVHCNWSDWVNSDHRWWALNGLADWCGVGGRWFNSRSVSVQAGNAVAYGCNYLGGGGTTCYRQPTLDRLNEVSNTCGWNTAGWYSLGQGTTSYGYTAAGIGFC